MAGYSEKEKEKHLAAAKEDGGSSSGVGDLQDTVGNETLKSWFGKAPKDDQEYPNINLDAARLKELEPEYDQSEGEAGGGVKYLTREERKRAKVRKDADGLYRQGPDGERIPLADQFDSMYAITPKGGLYVYQGNEGFEFPDGNKNMQHSSFTGGRPVQAAGYLEVEGGEIPRLGAESGHYKPDKSRLKDAALGLMAKDYVSEDVELAYSGSGGQEPLWSAMTDDDETFVPAPSPMNVPGKDK